VIVLGTGAVSIGNGGARALFGCLYYRLGAKRTLLLVALLALTAAVLLIVSLLIKNSPLLLAALLFAGTAYGSESSCVSAFVMDYFGAAYFSLNYSLICAMGIVSSIIGTFLVGILQTRFNSYPLSFSVLLIYALVSAALYRLIPSQKEMKRKEA
jgi:OFA family oxalate/formate antiporter-like MFS transporter